MDGTNVTVYSYEGRSVSNPRFQVTLSKRVCCCCLLAVVLAVVVLFLHTASLVSTATCFFPLISMAVLSTSTVATHNNYNKQQQTTTSGASPGISEQEHGLSLQRLRRHSRSHRLQNGEERAQTCVSLPRENDQIQVKVQVKDQVQRQLRGHSLLGNTLFGKTLSYCRFGCSTRRLGSS